MNNIFEPRFHKAWNEALLKEQKIRVKWLEEYNAKQEAAAKEDEKLNIHEVTLFPTSDVISASRIDWPKEGATGTSTLIRVADTPSQMRPPEPIIKSKLFEGTSRDGHGRAAYLKRRYKEDPKDKFYGQICTSWSYGWNQNANAYNELSCSKSPSQCDIKKTAFRNP